ncbi:MAG: transposase, partial [Pseudomonadota bacterium]
MEGRTLPSFVIDELTEFLDCGILAKGFLRLFCETCGRTQVLAFSCKKRGFCPSCGGRRMADSAAHLVDNVFPERPVRQWVLSFPYNLRYLFAYHPKALQQALTVMMRVIRRYYLKKSGIRHGQTGAVTLIQRFGGSINMNPHFHVLFVDGVFDREGEYLGVNAPTNEEVADVVEKIHIRVFRSLEKKGYIRGYDVNLEEDKLYQEHGAMTEILMGSIQNKNLLGRKVETLGKLGPGSWAEIKGNRCVYKDGFSLHANVCISAYDRPGLEHLCRYICRPPISNERLKEGSDGAILYELKRPWNDGSTHIKFTPELFIQRLMSLVPPPRLNLIRYFGVLGPHAKNRKKVVPPPKKEEGKACEEVVKINKYRIQWARLLKRVFKIEVTKCPCGGQLKIIAAITTAEAITRI